MVSVEQMCRDLLEQALNDDLVDQNFSAWSDPHPQARSAGELAGVANLLAGYLEKATVDLRNTVTVLRNHLSAAVERVRELEAATEREAVLRKAVSDTCNTFCCENTGELCVDTGLLEKSCPCDTCMTWALLRAALGRTEAKP